MAGWHDEIVRAVRQQLKDAAEEVERERRCKAAAIEFFGQVTKCAKLFCQYAKRQLGGRIFTVDLVQQDGNYVCTLVCRVQKERIGGISLNSAQSAITITASGNKEMLGLESGGDGSAVAVHNNNQQFSAEELAEEFIRMIAQVNAGRRFQPPLRMFGGDDEVPQPRD